MRVEVSVRIFCFERKHMGRGLSFAPSRRAAGPAQSGHSGLVSQPQRSVSPGRTKAKNHV